MSAKMRHPRQTLSQQDNITSEITYPQDELGPADVEDILDRLHIGTLRREELKARRSILSTSGDGEISPMDDKALEDFYRHDGAHAERRQVHRQTSRASVTSMGSTASAQSGSSAGETRLSRQSSSSSKRHSSVSTEMSTQEMGIQTTIGRSSNGLSTREPQTNDTDSGSKKKERKPSTKDKMKKLFRKKSSTSQTDDNSNDTAIPVLPQGFIVKYMGKRPTKGLWGSKHTRGPVEEIVDSIGQLPKGEDLPLVNLEVYYQGLAMRPHSKNKVKTFKPVQIPIQFISYGLQDTVYPRIFCFIMVKEMSSQSKSMECHAYACDTSKSARELAACLAMAFQSYSEKLDGGAFKFSIDVKMTLDEDEGETPANNNCYDA